MILADTSRSGAASVIDRIAQATEDWNRKGHLQGFNLSLSIGVSEWQEGRTFEEILNAADQEMYANKSTGQR